MPFSPAPEDVPPSVPRRRKATRPQELLEAALALFVEKGFAATRLDDIARIAGVSKGTVYLYFSSKEALFAAVIREGIVPVIDAAEAMAAAHAGTASALLRDLLHGWWQQIGATRLAGVPKLMISEALNFPDVARYYHDQVIVRGRALIGAALQRGVAAGEFRPLDVDTAIDVIFAPLLMRSIWQVSLGPCCGAPDGSGKSPEHFLDLHVDLLLNGLVRPGPTENPDAC